jgi:hypothetical protein
MPIQWLNDRPESLNLPDLPLRRLRASEQITGTITSNQALRVITHFYGARTLPCIGDGCPGCAAHRERRREGYFSIETHAGHLHGILGVTDGAMLNLSDKAPDWNHLRGLEITVRRKGKKVNGRVNIDVHGLTLETQRLPPAPDLKRHMFHIWGLDSEQMPEDHPLFAYQRELILSLDNGNGARPRQAK